MSKRPSLVVRLLPLLLTAGLCLPAAAEPPAQLADEADGGVGFGMGCGLRREEALQPLEWIDVYATTYPAVFDRERVSGPVSRTSFTPGATVT